ncbi:hypothetical protein [Enterobacter hormaechei]|uniref:hypothetical protein n=1 Tax=Enterobacter hormaechei TaxID=158836 RepID=UPI003F4417D0
MNSLSDREENDVSDFFGFAELLIDDIKHTKPFYLVMSVPGVYGVNLINTVTTDEVDRIDKWLHSVDEQAAQNYAELRSSVLQGGFDKVNDRFIVEAIFYKPNYTPRY